MDISFIYKSLRLTFLLTVVLSLFFLYYFGTHFTAGFVSGSFWNIVNILVLIGFSKALMNAPRNKQAIALYGFLKFGALYAIGYVLIAFAKVSIYGICAGFSLLFAVIFLQVLGKVFLREKISYGGSGKLSSRIS